MHDAMPVKRISNNTFHSGLSCWNALPLSGVVTSTWRIIVNFGNHITPDFITYDNLSKSWSLATVLMSSSLIIMIVITFFLHQYSWYDMLADAMHLQILTEDSVITTNQIPDFLCNYLYHCTILTLSLLCSVAGHLLHGSIFQFLVILECLMSLTSSTGTVFFHSTLSKGSAAFPLAVVQITGKTLC
jgi:hypothetical protein